MLAWEVDVTAFEFLPRPDEEGFFRHRCTCRKCGAVQTALSGIVFGERGWTFQTMSSGSCRKTPRCGDSMPADFRGWVGDLVHPNPTHDFGAPYAKHGSR